MELVVEDSTITVQGQLHKYSDYEQVRAAVEQILETGAVELLIRIPESTVIFSSLVGLFVKFADSDEIRLSLELNRKLYDLFEELNLIEVMNISKIQN